MLSFLHRAKPMLSLLHRRTAPAPVAHPVGTSAAAVPLVRQPADRSAHRDDQHLVFWNAEQSRVSGAQLSEAASSWHQAVSGQPRPGTPGAAETDPRMKHGGPQ